MRYLSWQKIKFRIYGAVFYLLHWRRINIKSLPIIDGYLPKIYCSGKIILNGKCVFRSYRSRQHLTSLSGSVLDIGNNIYLNDGVIICASLDIRIGDSVKIGDMVYIYDSDFHQVAPETPVRKKPVRIGNNVWIGANSMILAGATIGDHSVIAAGSIVTGEIPAKCVAAGSPARVIKTFEVPDNWIRP